MNLLVYISGWHCMALFNQLWIRRQVPTIAVLAWENSVTPIERTCDCWVIRCQFLYGNQSEWKIVVAWRLHQATGVKAAIPKSSNRSGEGFKIKVWLCETGSFSFWGIGDLDWWYRIPFLSWSCHSSATSYLTCSVLPFTLFMYHVFSLDSFSVKLSSVVDMCFRVWHCLGLHRITSP